MKEKKSEFTGIWPLVEEYELRKKVTQMGYILQKDHSSKEKLIVVIKEFANATNTLRFLLLSIFIVISEWSIAISIISVLGSLIAINSLFDKKKRK